MIFCFIWLLLFPSEKFLFYFNFHESIRSTTVNLKIKVKRLKLKKKFEDSRKTSYVLKVSMGG